MPRQRPFRKLVLSVVGALIVVGGLGSVPAGAQPVVLECGAVVTSDVVLGADIGPCHNHGVVVGADDVTVDLNGHRIFGEGGTVVVHQASGVFSDNHIGVVVTNGTIHGFYHGARIRRGGHNLVTRITARDNQGGNGIVFETSTDNVARFNTVFRNGGFAGISTFNTNALPPAAARNTIADNIVYLNRSHGISIENGPGHVVRRNQVSSNTRDGISLFGGVSGVTVEANQVASNTLNGINVRAGTLENTVRFNTVYRNTQHGIIVSGALNAIVGNIARGNLVLDLRDTNPGCDANLWSGNRFGTASPPCTRG